MQTLVIFESAYRKTFTLGGKRVSRQEANWAQAAAKKTIYGGTAFYNLKGFDVVKGKKTRFFLEN